MDTNKFNTFSEKEYFKHLLRLTPSSVYWKDINGVYLGCNLAMLKMTGISSFEEIIGKRDIDLPWSESVAQILENDKAVITSGKQLYFEETGKLSNATVKTFISNKMPLISKSNEIMGVIGSSIDITDIKQAERAKQVFLQNMAHDIRTPLSGIIGVSELFERGLIKPEETNAFGKMLRESGNQLLELLNVVIQTIDTEHMVDPVKTEPLHLLGLAEEIQALFQPNLVAKPLELHLEIAPQLPIVLTDRIKLKRILINILSNAIKFTKEGKITFAINLLSSDDKNVKIEMFIKDTGIGIAPDKLDQIFDQFYRVYPTYSEEYSGYGIGLYAVKKTMELLNGEIKVSSEFGKGTCFTLQFTFPLAHPIALQSPKLFISEENLFGSKNETVNRIVLVVEDHPIVCAVTKRMLMEADYNVVVTMDGEAALTALKEQSFDWVLLDIGLPKLNGYEVCQQYRNWEKENNRSPVPIFALTGHSVDEVGAECRRVGMNKVFTKPFIEKVLNEIETFIGICELE